MSVTWTAWSYLSVTHAFVVFPYDHIPEQIRPVGPSAPRICPQTLRCSLQVREEKTSHRPGEIMGQSDGKRQGRVEAALAWQVTSCRHCTKHMNVHVKLLSYWYKVNHTGVHHVSNNAKSNWFSLTKSIQKCLGNIALDSQHSFLYLGIIIFGHFTNFMKILPSHWAQNINYRALPL